MTKKPQEATPHPFRLISVSEDSSAAAGGVPAVVNQLSHRVALQGHPVHMLYAKGGDMSVSLTGIEHNCAVPTRLGSLWGWSPQLRKCLERLASLSGPSVFHLHGIWAAPQYVAATVATERSIPFVLSAHGMLEPWLWDQQGWKVRAKKRLYWNMLGSPTFTAASVIHAITSLEQQHLRDLFPSNRIEVIPNAIDLNEYPENYSMASEPQKLIVFLGRIEPKKGVDILLQAFAQAKIDNEWCVAIIGPVWSQAYQASLELIVAEHSLGDRVVFVGPVFGEDKRRWISKAWVMAVPSHSEVVGLVNLEAAAFQVPSITTYQTGLTDWASGGGLLIQPNVGEMKKALENVCSWSDRERLDRGSASRNLVAAHYSWRVILPLWMSLYESIQ